MLNWFHSAGGPTLPELVRQGLSSIEGGYDQLSSKFDQSVFRTPDCILDALKHALPAAQRALDIGCGTGAVMQRVNAPRRTGIDLSRAMLERARENLGEGPELIQGDFLRTYWEEQFDLITSVGVLGHIAPARQQEFFRRIHRALRPNGVFVTVVADLTGRPWVALPARLFDTAMAIRNTFWWPRFVMYYLSFVLPKAAHIVAREGFRVEILGDRFPEPFTQLKILRARKLGGG